jgi:ubiquinone/menaquinone biosynthesis C-methylase UbiE/Tfp pilus assembly protein PilF
MNRQQRRAQKNKDVTSSSFLDEGIKFEHIEIKPLEIVKIPDNNSPEFLEALNYIKGGKIKEAAQAYQKIFNSDKNNTEIGNILAALYIHIEKYHDAENLLRLILKKKPDDVFALNNLASSLIRQFNYSSQTERLLIKALTIAPHIAEINHNAGVFYHRQSQCDKAFKGYSNAKNIKLFHETLVGLGFACLSLSKVDEAKIFLDQALKLKPEDAQCFYGFSILEERNGNFEKALFYASYAIAYAPENYMIVSHFGKMAKSVTSYEPNPIMPYAILKFLSYPKVSHKEVFLLWINVINNQEKYKNLRHVIFEEKEISTSDFDLVKDSLNDEFFWRGLRNLPIKSIPLETFLINLRKFFVFNQNYLTHISQHFLSSFSELMFFNEYIYQASEKEKIEVKKLREKILSGDNLLKLDVLLFSLYEPLYQKGIYKNILKLEQKSEDSDFSYVVRYQIKEREIETKIKTRLKTFGDISNEVSQNVKAQYEDNPYPRWKYIADTTTDYKNLLKLNRRTKWKALVAGCGTGQQSVSALASNPSLEITAIDITASSLAYAIRKTDEIGLKNVSYYMGDILDIEELGEKYDYVFCSGVLHHMKDPMEGWKKLYDVLKPGGAMSIGLYSEQARKAVVEARRVIKQKGFTPDKEGLISMRNYIIDQPKDGLLYGLTNWNDFYTASMFRDLVFHVQEHRFTIPMIREYLDEMGLLFLRFENNNPLTNRFFKKYPDPIDQQNLNLWHKFEQAHPDTFVAMYNFVCAKPQ